MKIQSITYKDDHGMDVTYGVDVHGVTEIIEHSPQGEGDKWYYDVVFENKIERIFQFDRLTLSS